MTAKKRVLVIEDDPQLGDIIQWNLRLAGFEPILVDDGLAALVSFDRDPPALVTIDLNVPSVSGFRLVEIFKRHAPHVPVIVVTALSFEEAEDTARAGADDFVNKPFDPQQLLQKVAYHLNQPRSFDQLLPTALPSRPLHPVSTP